MIGFSKFGLDPNAVETVFISHLHGDHFAGLVWWLMHAQHVAKRSTPLDSRRPGGRAGAVRDCGGGAVSGLYRLPRAAIELRFVELAREKPLDVGSVRVTPFEVNHPSGAPPYALRFEVEGKVLSFSGDTEWTESLVPAGRGADLYIMECYQFEGEPRFHMSWKTIARKLDRIGAKRVMLTHMAGPMLARRGEVSDPRVVIAEDGLVLEV